MSNKLPARSTLPQARPISLMEMRMAALTAAVSACHANTDSMLREADRILAWLTAPYTPPAEGGQ